MQSKNKLNLNKRRSFTLLELLVATLIVAVAVTLVLPMGYKAMEAGNARNAFGAMKLIWAGEKIYHLKYGHYIAPSGAFGIPNDAAGQQKVYDILKVANQDSEPVGSKWNFRFLSEEEMAGLGLGTLKDNFWFEAVRPSGSYQYVYRVDENGRVVSVPTGSSPFTDNN